jgi:MFS family permease
MNANARLFIWFRVLFNCRFYYPIFTILFLDLGLSLGEFAALNVVWAVTIVLLEVPSGALADRYGRRPLVMAASVLMVLEMLVLCAMQKDAPEWVFWLFVVNRILSGAAEACASGADEALAYDALPAEDRISQWPVVMAQLMRYSAIGVVISSVTGAWLYTLWAKWPVVLCLCSALGCLAVSWRMTESWNSPPKADLWASMAATWQGIGRTGAWIWHSQAAFALVLLGLVFDSLTRLFMTVNSNFYRLIGIEDGWLGVIGSAMAMLGLLLSWPMKEATQRIGPVINFSLLGLLLWLGLMGAAQAAPGWAGVMGVLPLFVGMRFLHFFLSHYMNAIVPSEQRATALSFRGLSMNLAYGGITLLFGWHTAWLAQSMHLPIEDMAVFAQSLQWWPGCFVVMLVAAGGVLGLRGLKLKSREG